MYSHRKAKAHSPELGFGNLEELDRQARASKWHLDENKNKGEFNIIHSVANTHIRLNGSNISKQHDTATSHSDTSLKKDRKVQEDQN
jgi:hypothetical protein